MTDLPKRELGRTGLQVTMLGYGAMELHGAPRGRETSEEQAETILNALLDAGINYIDTSIGGAAKGAPTEGKQAGLQWQRWQTAKLDDPAGRYDPHGVHPALHLHQPRPGHHHRRHGQPGAPAS